MHAVDVTIAAGRTPAIALTGVRRVFDGGVVAVDGVDLEVRSGELVAILGPSGCGKSTLLRLVAGLDAAQGGSVAVAARGPGAARGGRISFVFQDAHLLPWRTVQRNVELPLELAGIDRPSRAGAAARRIAQVGLTDAARRYPAQLSGGMRMRASLARALVTDPELLLLDEPFAAVDEITRQYLDEQLLELWAQRRITVLFVTHSIAEAAFLAERVVVLSPRPARVVAEVAGLGSTPRTAALRADPALHRLVGSLHDALARGAERP
jgi:NitT/TauT family transport system ATP-binding protein